MAGVKKIICSRPQLADVLLYHQVEGYNIFTVYFTGHPKHTSMGLVPQQILVYAWRYTPRPDKLKLSKVEAPKIEK